MKYKYYNDAVDAVKVTHFLLFSQIIEVLVPLFPHLPYRKSMYSYVLTMWERTWMTSVYAR